MLSISCEKKSRRKEKIPLLMPQKRIMFDLQIHYLLLAIDFSLTASHSQFNLHCKFSQMHESEDTKTIPNFQLVLSFIILDFFTLFFYVKTNVLTTPETAQHNVIHTHNFKSVAGFQVTRNKCLEMTKQKYKIYQTYRKYFTVFL